jgi:hypothetical protein
MSEWAQWRLFPDPREQGILIAPFGSGCYELRNGNQLVLFGTAGHVAHRMSSLLLGKLGCGTRKNSAKRKLVLENLGRLEYRTLACSTPAEARAEERKLRGQKGYLFST